MTLLVTPWTVFFFWFAGVVIFLVLVFRFTMLLKCTIAWTQHVALVTWKQRDNIAWLVGVWIINCDLAETTANLALSFVVVLMTSQARLVTECSPTHLADNVHVSIFIGNISVGLSWLFRLLRLLFSRNFGRKYVITEFTCFLVILMFTCCNYLAWPSEPVWRGVVGDR